MRAKLSTARTGTGTWLRIGGVAAAGLLVTALASVPANPAGATSHPVRVGRVPQPGQGAVKLAPLPRTTELRVDVSLQPRDPAALAAYAKAVSTPGTDLYRHYLAPGAFAGTYGPTQQAITTVEQALIAAGLRPGRISGNHLSIPVRATAAQLSSAFSTGFQQYQVSDGRVAYANDAAPLIGDGAAPYVQGVVGLDDLYVPTPTSATRPSVGAGSTPVTPAATPAAPPAVSSGGPQPCPTAVSDGQVDDAYTANQLASAYGFSSLYSAGDLGAGQTVALLEFAGYSTSDISAYESCYGEHTSITTVNTDGGPEAKSNVGEADGDIEDVSGLAPDANIVVYQAPNTNTGWFDNWQAAVSQDAAKVISISWGLCEQFDGSGFTQENTILEQAAAQGQTFLASAGDAGSEDCLGPHDENDYVAVDDPASQPYITGVGGTQWTSTGTPPDETAWNDGVLQCGGSADCFGGGGGGISENWPMPDYQTDGGAINGDSSGTPCGASVGQYCREVPDVSALAGPYPYLFYITGGWEDWGGTSFASPLWAALVALSDASRACDGESVGFANPTLYSIAGSDSSAFNDITSGNNDITGANGGLYPALTGYDMATGLGSPNGATLPSQLCLGGTADGIAVTNPGSQSTYPGQSVDLQITASDTTQGQTLSYAALGLPQGLSIDPSSGVISGVATTPGVYDAVVVAEAPGGASASAAFTWSVPASITGVKPAYGPAGGNTKVTITGSGFTGATQVRFGANQATTFAVNKAGTKITSYSPSGTGSVGLTVTGPSGTSLPVTFEYGPTITGVSRTSGPPGTKVNIKGTDLTGATVTFFNGAVAPIVTDTAKKVTVDVPSGATTGPITVTTVGGTATSAIFDVT